MDGGHFPGLTRPVHADGGTVACHLTKCRPIPLEGQTLLERDIRENWLALLLLLLLLQFLPPSFRPSEESRQSVNTAWNRYESNRSNRRCLPNWRHFSRKYVLRLVARKADDDIMTFNENYTSRQTTFPPPIVCFASRLVARVR